ncbi:hypothetical protein B1H10_06290 [candidate division KSB1 bacterium 4484_188]|nr:MAG: hypothetical protein B1H10_06290 [candidate division KSB1 bacterium 4484_188]
MLNANNPTIIFGQIFDRNYRLFRGCTGITVALWGNLVNSSNPFLFAGDTMFRSTTTEKSGNIRASVPGLTFHLFSVNAPLGQSCPAPTK